MEPAFNFDKDVYTKPDVVIVGEKSCGLKYFRYLFSNCGIDVIDCKGNRNIDKVLLSYLDRGQNVLVIFNSTRISNVLFNIYDDLQDPNVQCFYSDFMETILHNSGIFTELDSIDEHYANNSKSEFSGLDFLMESQYKKFPFLLP